MYNIHTIIRLLKFMDVNKLPKNYSFDGVLICKNCHWAEKTSYQNWDHNFKPINKITTIYKCTNKDNEIEFDTYHSEVGLRRIKCKYFNSPKQLTLF